MKDDSRYVEVEKNNTIFLVVLTILIGKSQVYVVVFFTILFDFLN